MTRFAMFVMLATLTALVAGCGKKTPEATDAGSSPAVAAPGPAAPGETSRFQGTWAVVKLDLLAGGDSPEVGAVSDVERAKIEVTITDKLAKVVIPTHDGFSVTRYVVLALDNTKAPSEIDLVESDQTGATGGRSVPTAKNGKSTTMEVPRERYTGVYKFEGETLVVAVPLDTSTLRPAEFKPVVLTPPGSRKVPVAVVHLKKK